MWLQSRRLGLHFSAFGLKGTWGPDKSSSPGPEQKQMDIHDIGTGETRNEVVHTAVERPEECV